MRIAWAIQNGRPWTILKGKISYSKYMYAGRVNYGANEERDVPQVRY